MIDSRGPPYDARGPLSMYSGTVYDGHAPRLPPPHPALTTIQSEGWASASLPDPRRGPMTPRNGESVIAPRRHQHHGQHALDHAQSLHNHHHHHDKDDFDSQSDASYYARPKMSLHRSASSSSQSDMSSPREQHHRRLEYASHNSSGHDRSPSLPPVAHAHSPGSPSPLSLASGAPPPAPGSVRSPLSPTRHKHESYGHAHEGNEERRARRSSNLVPDGEDRPKLKRQASLPGPGDEPYPRPHGSENGEHHHRHHSSSHLAPPSVGEDGHVRGRHHSDSHRRHHSGSHIPPPQAHSHSHSFRAPSPQPVFMPSSAVGPGPSALPIPRESQRRRAVSMQFEYERPPVAQSVYQTPSVSGTDMYDDGASIAGSAMTFMDGSVGGRVSQYGLPKYAHAVKPDYRR